MPDGKNSNHGKFDADGVAAFLRLHHPVATANNVCARSGISASTVDKWLRGLSAPSPDHLATLTAAYGPDFLASAFPGAAPWLEQEATKRELRAAVDALRSTLARAELLAG